MSIKWTREDRWIPVTESGQRWVGRSLEDAQESMRCYPVGGEYQEGDPWDGITHLEHEFRYVTEWEESA